MRKLTCVKMFLAIVAGVMTVFQSCTEQEIVFEVRSLELNCDNPTLTEGETMILSPKISVVSSGIDSYSGYVNWSSSDETVATVSISGDYDGEVHGVAPGNATITVTIGDCEASCDITVVSSEIPISSIVLDKNEIELTEGSGIELEATVKPDNATNKNLIWSTSNEDVATVDNGKVTAVSPGTATITVTSEDGEKSDECRVTVTRKVYPVESVTLDKSEIELTEGSETELEATVKPDNATNKKLLWTSSDEDIATVDNGKVTAVSPGTATITVTSEDGGKSGECRVTVTRKIYPVESVTLDKDAIELTEGDETELEATVNPDNATNKNVTWSSSDDTIASVAEGEVIALKPGTAIITVTTEDGGESGYCIITVREIPVESIQLDMENLEMTEGEEAFLTATVLPANATNRNIKWSSSDNTVATVNGGTVRAISAGSVTIIATTESGGKTATCNITVKERIYPVTDVRLSRTALTLMTGDESTLTATISPDNATNKNIIWSSNDESIASVSDGKVTAHTEGTAIITVTTEDGAKTASCTVTVTNDITRYVVSSYRGGAISSINGYIQPGSQLNFGVNNNTRNKTITVVSAQLMDSTIGYESNVMQIGTDIQAGSGKVWTITIPVRVRSPKVRFVYTFEGQEYQTEAEYVESSWPF